MILDSADLNYIFFQVITVSKPCNIHRHPRREDLVTVRSSIYARSEVVLLRFLSMDLRTQLLFPLILSKSVPSSRKLFSVVQGTLLYYFFSLDHWVSFVENNLFLYPFLLSPNNLIAKPKGFKIKAVHFLALSFARFLWHSALFLNVSWSSERGRFSTSFAFLYCSLGIKLEFHLENFLFPTVISRFLLVLLLNITESFRRVNNDHSHHCM